jgi:hypothetical protein
VLGVDDPLVEVARPGVSAHRRQHDPVALCEAEQPRPALGLHGHSLREARRTPRPDLDLRVDQLSGGRFSEQLVALTRGEQLLEPVDELEGLGLDQRELLLEPDREVRRGLEDLARALEVQGGLSPARGQGQAR